MTYISKHISWDEATGSQTAEEQGIDNTPNADQLKHMRVLARNVFEPLREWAAEPINVNSFFRSEALNAAIGGSHRSLHMRGSAIDIDATGSKTNADLFHYIRENLCFDQMIWEFGDDENPDWIHVSYINDSQNRQEILQAYKDKKGKTKYKYWEHVEPKSEDDV
jgi:hypothetical protein